jgi:uncharacterized protein YlxW (UPF0749 family)
MQAMLSSVPGRDGLRDTLVNVSAGSHARGTGSNDPGGRRPLIRLPRRPARRPAEGGRGRLWRIGTPLVVLACGGLFVVSANNSQGTDLRPGRYTDLASVVEDEADAYAKLRDRAAALDAQVTMLSTAVSDGEVNRYQRRIERLSDPAGLEPRRGPGLTIVLSDAPEDVINSTSGDVNPLLVHQQDIQAVVNALWKGGASAVTIQGQRVVSTTGIKCQGNSVQLQGVPYPQPYVIQAVGDQGELFAAIEDDSYLDAYREDAADPEISVGWDLEPENALTAPAYDGLLDLSYARPLESATAP